METKELDKLIADLDLEMENFKSQANIQLGKLMGKKEVYEKLRAEKK